MVRPRGNCVSRVLTHGAIAAVVGYVLLHPVSMLIYVYSEKSSALPVWLVLRNAFRPTHVNMAIYFTLLSTGCGVIYGFHAWKKERLYEQVKTLSITDELTSLYNRRYLMSRLVEEVALAKRHNYRLSLIMIDVDQFKQFNDMHGHQQGDRVLRLLAKRLRDCTRAGDLVARYGGEEFAVVMQEADKTAALKQAERLRSEIARQSFPDEQGQGGEQLTISLGVAEFPTDAQDPDGLIKKADAQLYRAKARGRNLACASA